MTMKVFDENKLKFINHYKEKFLSDIFEIIKFNITDKNIYKFI